MRWLFMGVLVLMVALILSIAFMNHSDRQSGGLGRPADQQVSPGSDPSLIPRQPQP
jgi:hypothetical protein